MSQMIERQNHSSTSRYGRIAAVTAGLLLIPLIAMQFSHDVNWSVADFVLMGALLFITGSTIDFAIRKSKNYENRVWAVLMILAVFLFVWAELAVGLIGSPFAGS